MKIGSSFDTKLKRTLIKQYTQQYGIKNTIIISRSTRYLVLNCIGPIIATVAWIAVLLFIGGLNGSGAIIDLTIRILATISILVGGYYITGNFINYYMDFCIVTPNEIVGYSQYGIFHRKSKVAKTEDIKIITVDGSGFRRSLFDIGDINIFFEGNYSQNKSIINPGSISMQFISDVENIKNNIKRLLDLATAVEDRKRD